MNTTTVTATITDLDGQTWNNGKFTFTLYNPSFPTGPFTNGGVVLTLSQLSVSGSMSATGVITATLFDVSLTQPYGSVYQVSLASNTSAPGVTVPSISPVGTSQDFSTSLSAGLLGPRIYAGPGAYGYVDTEVITPSVGQGYYNVTSSVQRQWTGTAWVSISGGTGGGAPTGPAAGDLTGSYPNPVVKGSSNSGTTTVPGFAITGPLATGSNASPSVYISQGATQPTNWHPSGTPLGMNVPAGFGGNFLDFHINGAASIFTINSIGGISGAQFNASNSQAIINNLGSLMLRNTAAASTGMICWSSTAVAGGANDTVLSRSAASTLQLGTTSSSPANGYASLRLGQVLGGSGAPTIAAGAAAGTGPTVSVTGNNNAGQISITVGTSPTAGVLATITFNANGTYPTAPFVTMTPANSTTAGILAYVTTTTTTFVLNVSAALTASSTYTWNFLVMG